MNLWLGQMPCTCFVYNSDNVKGSDNKENKFHGYYELFQFSLILKVIKIDKAELHIGLKYALLLCFCLKVEETICFLFYFVLHPNSKKRVRSVYKK